jgi:seryl-tRNA(Sec) selenium transferase
LRVDGVTYAALAATLDAYAGRNISHIPFWRQALMSADDLAERASAMANHLGGRLEDGQSTIGAGSVPGMTIPSPVVVLAGEDHLYELLLGADVPILTRRESGSLVIDLRTVDPISDQSIMETIDLCR